MLRALTSAMAVVLVIGGVAAPPDSPPDTEPARDSATFERQLAEWSFGTFLTVELDVNPDVFTCTEPSSGRGDETLTCFGLIRDERIVIATTATSGATGLFDFDVIADYDVLDSDGPPDITEHESTDASEPIEPVPTTYSTADRNQANVAILRYGDILSEVAQNEIVAVLSAADGSVVAVNAWAWNAASATFTINFTLSPESGLRPDGSAWVAVTELSAHWQPGQPFREPAATIKPALVIIVGGIRYVSDWDLTVQVADQAITEEEWLAAARQP